MADLPYWGIAAIQIWICTRDLSYVQRRLTGDAKRDEEHVDVVLAQFKLDPLNLECEYLPEGYEKEKRLPVVSKKQAVEELLARLQSGVLKAQGVKCDPSNEGKPVSDTVQDIPACDWGYLKFGVFPRGSNSRYAAFYEHNDFPSWRHIVCPGAMVRQLWPLQAGSTKPLSDREQAARTFLEDWFKSGKPCRGAWSAAIRHVANTYCAHLNNPAEAAKKSTGAFVTAEIARLRKAASKAA